MCEPLTITAIGVGLAGAVMTANAEESRGNAALDIARRNAAAANRQAADAVARGALPAVRSRLAYGDLEGRQVAAEAASGALVGTGSALDVTNKTRALSDLDEQVIRNNAAREAYGYQTQAERMIREGEYAKQEGDNAAMASIISGVGSSAMIGAEGWLKRPDFNATAASAGPAATDPYQDP